MVRNRNVACGLVDFGHKFQRTGLIAEIRLSSLAGEFLISDHAALRLLLCDGRREVSVMLHIFADPADMQGDLLTVRGSEVNHIRNVMRLKPGDEVSVSNGVDEKEYRYGIEAFGNDPDGSETVQLRLRFVKDSDIELPVDVYLFQGLPKGDKMDLIVQKCVELGVHEVIPVAMHRCVMKLDETKAPRKVERWQKISASAAMQSRRRIIPEVTLPMSMREAIGYAREHCDVCVLPYELQEDDGSTKALLESLALPTDSDTMEGTNAQMGAGTRGGANAEAVVDAEGTVNAKTGTDAKGTTTAAMPRKKSVAVFIGPEGGFEPEEVEAAREAGVKPISLGRRILRTETAGMTVLAWLIYILEIS